LFRKRKKGVRLNRYKNPSIGTYVYQSFSHFKHREEMDQSIGNKGRYEYPATKTRVMTWCAEEIEIVNATGWSVGQGFVEYTFLVVGVCLR
jgi:hypothetical protein